MRRRSTMGIFFPASGFRHRSYFSLDKQGFLQHLISFFYIQKPWGLFQFPVFGFSNVFGPFSGV